MKLVKRRMAEAKKMAEMKEEMSDDDAVIYSATVEKV